MRLIPALLALASVMAPCAVSAQDQPSNPIILAEHPTPDGVACGISKNFIEAIAQLYLMEQKLTPGSKDDPGRHYYLHLATTTKRVAGQCVTYNSVRILTFQGHDITPDISVFGQYVMGEKGYLFSTIDDPDFHSRTLAWDLSENIDAAFRNYASNASMTQSE